MFRIKWVNYFLKIKDFLLLGSEEYIEIISYHIFTDKPAQMEISKELLSTMYYVS